MIHHALVESALLFQRAAFGQRQLYKDYVLAPPKPEDQLMSAGVLLFLLAGNNPVPTQICRIGIASVQK